jgi:hypothetical protein
MSRRGRRVLGLAGWLLGVAPLWGCGARSSVDAEGVAGDASGDGGAASCDEQASCSDLTLGTLRLRGNDGTDFGHLFFFDATPTCGGASTHLLLSLALEEDGRPCSRNGDYLVEASSKGLLEGLADNLGGSTGELCGGTPFDETLSFEMIAVACEPDRFSITIESNDPTTPYNFDGVATRCRCGVPWVPCKEPLPDDPCGER